MRLSQADLEYILEALELSVELRARIEKARSGGGVLTLDDADTLRDLCGERLQICGFDSEYRPTEEGERLEKLIDELFSG